MIDECILNHMMMATIYELQKRQAFKRSFRKSHTIAHLEAIVHSCIEENREIISMIEASE